MADPTNSAPLALPVLASPVSVGIIVSAVSQILAALTALGVKIDITDDQLAVIVSGGFQIVALASLLYALYKRWTSKVQPLALTNAGAEVKSAAIATAAGNTP